MRASNIFLMVAGGLAVIFILNNITGTQQLIRQQSTSNTTTQSKVARTANGFKSVNVVKGTSDTTKVNNYTSANRLTTNSKQVLAPQMQTTQATSYEIIPVKVDTHVYKGLVSVSVSKDIAGRIDQSSLAKAVAKKIEYEGYGEGIRFSVDDPYLLRTERVYKLGSGNKTFASYSVMR